MSQNNADRGRFVVIGNPESRRVESFGRAVRAATGQRATVISWTRILRGEVAWEDLPAGPLIVRLESPGKNWEVERALLARGADVSDPDNPAGERWSRLTRAECVALAQDHGRLLGSRQWYLGFRSILQELARVFGATSQPVRWFVEPCTVAQMFDKAATDAALQAHGIPVPPGFGLPTCFDDFLARLKAAGRSRAFLKLCHGSSASGAVAFERRGDRWQAFTTVAVTGNGAQARLYNTRPVRRLTARAEIAQVVDALCRERLLAQAWIPKAGWQGHRCDLRVVLLAERILFVVPRLSHTPFTNLQLGARRGQEAELAQFLGPERYAALLQPALDCRRAFPGALSLALDLAPDVRWRRSWVLEANAFGDDLPGLTEEGRTLHEWAVSAALGAQSRGMRSSTPSPKTS